MSRTRSINELIYFLCKIISFFIILNIFTSGLFFKASGKAGEPGEIIIQLSTTNPAMNEEITILVKVVDYGMFSVENLPLNITLTSLTTPPRVSNRPFLDMENIVTDENGTFSTIFNAPILSFVRDAYYEINVETTLKYGKVSSSKKIYVQEKIYDTRSNSDPIDAAPCTWYQVLMYDFDFKPITISVTQNGHTRTSTYKNDDWETIGETGTGNEITGESKVISKVLFIGDELATLKRYEGKHGSDLFNPYPDNSILYTFLVTEIFEQDITLTISGYSNGREVVESFKIPTKRIHKPIIGISEVKGDWAFTTSIYDSDRDNIDYLGTEQNSFNRIYGIGFRDQVVLKIISESSIILEEKLLVENYLLYYEWTVPKKLTPGNYTLSIEGTDFNGNFSVNSIKFYVGKEPVEMGLVAYTLCYSLIIIIIIVSFFATTFSYSRLKKKYLLNHLIRKRIYEYIELNPGIHYRGLLNALNLKVGTLSHHINRLEDKDFIKSRQDGMYRRFYLMDKDPIKILKLHKKQNKILETIKTTPGISQKDISRRIGISRYLTNYHVKILLNAGLISLIKEGRSSRCYINE